MTTISLDDFKKESRKRKRQEFVENLKWKFNQAVVWADGNKEILIVVIPCIAGAVKLVTKTVNKSINLKKEEQLKDLYCYDRSLGHYWKLRRELTNDEWIEIDKRKKQGERLADILSELKVLK